MIIVEEENMKKLRNLLLCLSIGCLLFTTKVQALETKEYFNSAENVTENVNINHSYFTSGNNVNSKSQVQGIHLIAGNNLELQGTSEYLLTAGNVINIDNTVERDIFVAGNAINIGKQSSIGRDLFAAGNTLTISANLSGNSFLAGNTINIDADTINGDITISAKEINIASNTIINGTLKYNSDATFNSNTTNIGEVKTYETKNIDENTVLSVLNDFVYALLTFVFLGFAINLLFPGIFKSLDKKLSANEIFNNTWNGLLFMFAVPIVSIILLATIIGVPIGIISLLIYVIMLYLSVLISSTYLGKLITKKIFDKKQSPYLEIFIGCILTKLVSLIPIVSVIYTIFLVLFGLGLIYNMILKVRKKNI